MKLVHDWSRRTLLLLLLLVLCPPAVGQMAADSAAADVRAKLTQLLKKHVNHAEFGLLVVNADTGEPWAAYEPHTPRKPASVMKLFTAAAMLERFGPDFTYTTRVYLRDRELWIVGAGDPAIGDIEMAEHGVPRADQLFGGWAAKLKQRGVERLSALIIDDSVFDRQWRHPDWPENQANRWYQAPVGGLNLNCNCLELEVDVQGRAAVAKTYPAIPARLIDNKLEVGEYQGPRVGRALGSDVFLLRGVVERDAPLQTLSANEPVRFFSDALKHAFDQDDLPIAGELVRQKLNTAALPGDALIAEYETKLSTALWRCVTFSMNMYAESFLKSLAAYDPDGQHTGTPGSWDAGRQVLTETLTEMGLDLDGAVFRDGSGLSHNNRVTAVQVVDLLTTMRKHRHWKTFEHCLARAGEDGTMQRRYADPRFKGRLKGKTGTLSRVKALAGFLERPDGTTLAFVIMMEGRPAPTLIPDVCRAMLGAKD